MIHGILGLPVGIGLFVFALLVAAIGLVPYFVAHLLIRRHRNQEVRDVAYALFRISGAILALLLSLIFANVRSDYLQLRNSIQVEAALISDIYADLNHFPSPEDRDVQAQVVGYLNSIVNDEWGQLSQDRLSQTTGRLYNQIQEAILNLEMKTSGDEALRQSILGDLDRLSDYRMMRWYHATADPPDFLYVALIGFVFTISLLSIFPPRSASVVLIGCACAVIGIVMYFIIAMSDPFHGAMSVTAEPLEIIYQEYLATK